MLKDQVAVITGASSGIGVAAARELRSAGVKLVISARREERLAALAEELGETVVICGDILDPEMPQRLIDAALDGHGRCDIVLNNAGLLETGPIDTIDLDRVRLMVRVNVEAAFVMAYVALRHFKSVGKGHLVNTSSVVGTKVRPTVGGYAGTKYAIEALSEALRLELAKTDIRVSCIEPGLVATELHQRWPVPPAQSMGIQSPLTGEDIARCIRFILEQPAHVRIPRLMILPGEHEI